MCPEEALGHMRHGTEHGNGAWRIRSASLNSARFRFCVPKQLTIDRGLRASSLSELVTRVDIDWGHGEMAGHSGTDPQLAPEMQKKPFRSAGN